MNSELSYSVPNIIGSVSFIERIKKFAHSVSFCDSPILITGETGTGKSLIANYVFQMAQRNNYEKTIIPLSEIPIELFESQLFGFKKGSFTGATENFMGLLQAGENGTIILEEIDCLPLYMQPKILRLIEKGEFISIGHTKSKKCNVHIIATTNRNLKNLVEAGEFRKDLFYRLNVLNLEIPPLRHRKKDIKILIEHFSNHFSLLYRRSKLVFSHEALEIMSNYLWPGNVRELKSEIERLYVFVDKNAKEISFDDLSPDIIDSEISETTRTMIESVNKKSNENERQKIVDCLNRNRWNKSNTAKELGISRKHLYTLIRIHQIKT